MSEDAYTIDDVIDNFFCLDCYKLLALLNYQHDRIEHLESHIGRLDGLIDDLRWDTGTLKFGNNT